MKLQKKVQQKIVQVLHPKTGYRYAIPDAEFSPNGLEVRRGSVLKKDDRRSFHANTVLAMLSFLLRKNHLMSGDPGHGKTTTGAIISSLCTGLPYNLFEFGMLKGSKGALKFTEIGRPDLGAMHQGTERVNWQAGFALPALNVDEINRYNPTFQNDLLIGIETGRWVILNDQVYLGQRPSFITKNDRDVGTNGIIPPLMDRIDIYTVNEYRNSFLQRSIDRCTDNVKRDLVDEDWLTELLDVLQEKGFKEFQKALQPVDKPELQNPFTQQELDNIYVKMHKMRVDPYAAEYLMAYQADLSHSEYYGVNRRSDPQSTHAHDLQYGCTDVLGGPSPRRMRAVMHYAKGLAWFLGASHVTKQHVRFILPYCTALLDFTTDFLEENGGQGTGLERKLFGAVMLEAQTHERYDNQINKTRLLLDRIRGRTPDGKKVTGMSDEEILALDPNEYPHPYGKEIIDAAQRSAAGKYYTRFE